MSQKFTEADAITGDQLHHVLTGNVYKPHDTLIRLEEINLFKSIDHLFGTRYYKIVFITTAEEIGHWVLLTHLGENTVEYFDSAGKAPPEILLQWFSSVHVSDVQYSTVQLQHKDSFNCGRFVLARISSQPTPLQSFIDILSSSKSFSPDDMVNALFNVDNVF